MKREFNIKKMCFCFNQLHLYKGLLNYSLMKSVTKFNNIELLFRRFLQTPLILLQRNIHLCCFWQTWLFQILIFSRPRALC